MNLKAVLEGLLFLVGDDGVSLNQICEILDVPNEDVKNIILELNEDYKKEDRGLMLSILGNKFKLITKKEHKEYYQKLVDTAKNEILSQAALETLAIIAYNEPVTRSQVEEIRGVDCSHMIRKLLFRNLIEEKGRSEAPGRPTLYGVTDQFLDYMGLSTVDELPSFDFSVDSDNDEETNLFESKYKE